MDSSKGSFDWSEFVGDRWAPKEIGDSITGLIVNMRVEDGRSGKVPVLTISTDDGSREVWAGQWDLKTKLADADIQANDSVTIVFASEKHTGQASPMKLFDLQVERGTGSSSSAEKPF
jgi:hypothetical protein